MADEDNKDDNQQDQPQHPQIVINAGAQQPLPTGVNNAGLYNAAFQPAPQPVVQQPIPAARSSKTATGSELDTLKANLSQQQAQQTGPQNVNLGLQQPQQGGAQQVSYDQEINPYMAASMAGTAGQVQALRGQSAAAQQAAKLAGYQSAEEAQTYQEAAQKAQDLTADYKKIYTDSTNELHNALHDLNEGHVNPNQFHENMSVPQKIMTAIGMIIAGAGAGITRQENPVVKWMNEQVNRDIEAQKANINSAYNHYAQQTNDARYGENMARALLQQNYANQIRATAAKYAGPIAQQNAAAIAAQFEGQANNLISQNAMQMAQYNQMQNMYKSAGSEPLQKLQALSQYGIIPKDQIKPIATEIGQAQNVQKSRQLLLSAFDRAAQENTVLKTGAGLLRTPASISEMRALSLPIIHDAEGRVNEFEQKTLSNLEPKPGDTDDKIKEKRQALMHFLEQKSAAPNANMYGISIPKPSEFNPLR